MTRLAGELARFLTSDKLERARCYGVAIALFNALRKAHGAGIERTRRLGNERQARNQSQQGKQLAKHHLRR